MPNLADLVLLVHLLFVAFVVGGLAAILCGFALGWRWVRAFPFRLLHLLAIAYVAAEALVGATCPLTAWEDALRGAGPEAPSFLRRLVQRILFYDLPEGFFAGLYLAVTGLTLALWRAVPPVRRRKAEKRA